MPAFQNLTLDTTGPGTPTVDVASGASTVTSVDVSVAISATGTPVQVKIYGDVDDTFATTQYRALEANAPWITLSSPHSVRLSSGDGTKVVKVKVRDAVDNPSAEGTDSVSLNTAVPTITLSAFDVGTISKQTGKRSAASSFTSDVAIDQWKVKAVPATGSTEAQGTTIPTTGGSTNMTGTTLAAATPRSITVDGADLETASAGDGTKVVKVFGRSAANGLWST